MAFPEFWIVAGPNGAGKTTCVQKEPISRILPKVAFLNPDDRTLEKLLATGFQGFSDAPLGVQTPLFVESANEIFAELKNGLLHDQALGIETVLSTDKYRELVEIVEERNGFIGLIYVALSSPAIAMQRVARRVRAGGHGIPDDKIAQRWERSLQNLAWFAAHATAFWVIDNSNSEPDAPVVLLASGRHGKMEFVDTNAFPEMKAALAGVPSR